MGDSPTELSAKIVARFGLPLGSVRPHPTDAEWIVAEGPDGYTTQRRVETAATETGQRDLAEVARSGMPSHLRNEPQWVGSDAPATTDDPTEAEWEANRAFLRLRDEELRKLKARESARQILAREKAHRQCDPASMWHRVDALFERKPPAYLIDGLVPELSVGYITGRDGTYKTFLALDFALRLACSGRPVMYLAGEGANSFGNRINAWLDARGRGVSMDALRANLWVRDNTVNLFAQGWDYEDLIRRVSDVSPELVVVDTLARSASGADQNSAADMSVITEALDEIRRTASGTVLVLAHTDKKDHDARGSSAIEDNADFVLHNKKKDGVVTVTVAKMKDGDAGGETVLEAKRFGPSIALVPPVPALLKRRSSFDLSNRIMAVLLSADALDLGLSLPELRAQVNEDEASKHSETAVAKQRISDVLADLKRAGFVIRSPEHGNRNVRFHPNPAKPWDPLQYEEI